MWTKDELINYCNTIKENLNTYHSKWESLIAAKQAALDTQGISYQSYNEFISGGEVIKHYAIAHTSETWQSGGYDDCDAYYNLSYSVGGPSEYEYSEVHDFSVEFSWYHLSENIHSASMLINANVLRSCNIGDIVLFTYGPYDFYYTVTEYDLDGWLSITTGDIADANHLSYGEDTLYYFLASHLIQDGYIDEQADDITLNSSDISAKLLTKVPIAYEITASMIYESSSPNDVVYITIDGENYYINDWPGSRSWTFNLDASVAEDIDDERVANAWLKMFEDDSETGHDTYLVLKCIFNESTDMGLRICDGMAEAAPYLVYYFYLSYPDEFFPGDTDEVYLVFTNPFNNEQRMLDITLDCRARTYAEEERYDTDFSDYWLAFLYECAQTFDTNLNEIDWTNNIEIKIN